MNHPSQDTLLLLAYGELAPAETGEIENHLVSCATCHATFRRLERARVAVDWGVAAERRPLLRRVAYAVLATAALIAIALLTPSEPPPDTPGWHPLTVWSQTAGYAAGGALVIEIDARLTRLEQEGSYGLPN
ncbi:MAG: hypothetical protein ACREMN_05305 [Gemmatimonadales bacterium]